MSKLLIKQGMIVTMNKFREIFIGDILIEDSEIKKIARKIEVKPSYKVVQAAQNWVLPGFIQTHVHLCQTLFRNHAEDLQLLDWLKQKIWPLEGRLTPQTLRLSVELGLLELLKSGTTTILDMGTVHHTDVIFETCEQVGFRVFSGKAMMDKGEGIPKSLQEEPEVSLDESLRLIERWHGKGDGRLHYALAPRFVLSSSEGLLRKIQELASQRKLLVHTHASESRQETLIVRKKKGKSNIRYLYDVGLCGKRSCFAHCIWIDEEELDLLAKTHTNVLHCPSSNLKLGSGIARIPEMISRCINVTLGADGAACNNNLDIFQEMRLAGLIQRPRVGVQSLPAKKIVEMATVYGAKALGLEDEIGSIEEGKKADVIIVEKETPHTIPAGDPYATLVYSARGSDVKTVLVDGKILMEDRFLTTLSEKDILNALKN